MQPRSERTRRIILKAAAEMFDTQGYLGTSLQDVVAGQGVSKGALYFHFPSKEQLASAIIEEERDLLPRLARELRENHPRAIRLFIEVCYRTAHRLRDDAMTRASTRLACERKQIGASVPPLFDSWIAILVALLDEAREQGDLVPNVDSAVVAEHIVTAFAGMQRLGYFAKPGPELRRHVSAMWRLLLPGLVISDRVVEIMKEIDDHSAGRELIDAQE